MTARKRGEVGRHGEPMEHMLVVVGWMRGFGPKRFIIEARVEADMACEVPDPPITVEEMQSVAFAAKMALAKVLRSRKTR